MTYQETAREYNLRGTYNGCCAYCGGTEGQKITDGCKFRTLCLCVDHIVTKANGGSNLITNLQILCNRCNSYKWAYNMPKLEPRQPELSAKKVVENQRKLKDTMTRRRMSAINNHIPKTSPLLKEYYS